MRQRHLVIFDLHQKPKFFKFFDDLRPCFKAVKPIKIRPGSRIHRGVYVHHDELFQIMTFSNLPVV